MPRSQDGTAFDETHIKDGDESKRVLKAPDRNGGAAENKRHRGVEDDLRPKAVPKCLQMGRRNAGHAAKKASNVASSAPPLQQSEAREPEIADCADGELDLLPSLDVDLHNRDDDADPSACRMESEPAGCARTEASTEPVYAAANGIGPGPPGQASNLVLGSVGAEDGGAEIGTGKDMGPAAVDSDADLIQQFMDGVDFDDYVDPKVLEELERSKIKLNQPLADNDPGSDSDEEAIPPNLSEDKFPGVLERRICKFRREYADALATSRSWEPNEISEVRKARARQCLELGTPITSVVLQRSDSFRFKLVKKASIFYVLRTQGGPELITIEHIFHPPDSLDVRLKYTRVLSSSDAVGCTDRIDDLREFHLSSSGQQICTRRYGSRNIQRQLDARKLAKKSELYHWGDVTYEARAADLLGPVYWIPLNTEDDFIKKHSSCSSHRSQVLADMKDVLLSAITNLDQVDFVVIGEPFSECRTDGNRCLGLCYWFCILMIFLLIDTTGSL